MARDNHTPAQREAVARYQAKTYRKINIALRMEEDADIIASIEEAREQGIPLREWLRELFDSKEA